MKSEKLIRLMIFKRFILCSLFGIDVASAGYAQSDSLVLKEVVVSGIGEGSVQNTSLNIAAIPLRQLESKGVFNLTDALSKLPGLSQMTTGISIAKPVIRGMFGNRVLVLVSGNRFDNQQWQDEHGLGLTQAGIDRIELIKGPASVLYGTDAVGGVINIIEEQPDKQASKIWDANIRFYSNTLGTLSDVGFKETKAKSWWRIRLGNENNADYADGNNQRVLNSRNQGYFLKAGFGFGKAKHKLEATYNFSWNQMGFILNDLKDFFSPDKRWTRVMAGPHHNVMLNVANVQNTFYGPNAVLKMNTGLQSNLRMEDEGGGKISLNMHLISVLNTLRWEKPLGNSNTLILANQLAYENNTNYGGRILIPDANMAEGGLSGFVRHRFERGVLEAGLSGNLRYIQTLPTRSLNLSSDEVKPLSTLRKAVNGILGFSFNPSKGFNLKSSFSTGFRAPNLAELSCNGLREGSYRYEIGNAKLKNEQNLCLDLTMEAKSRVLSVYVSAFANRFLNYIFIAPTVEQFYGFPVFRYSQANSLLYGGEAVFNLSPNQLKWWQWKNAFSIVFGKLDNGGNLPYIPAPKVVSSFRFEKMLLKKIRNLFLEPEAVMVLQQHRPAEFETATPAYWLLNCAAGFSFPLKSREMNISIVGQNLLNTAYADHLSRIKYFGMLNIGRNIMMRVQVTF